MLNLNEFTGDLRQSLVECDFSNHESIVIGQALPTTVISTNGNRAPQLICAVASIPDDLTDAKKVENFKKTMRKGLTSQFKGLPRPKRLGSCTILIGGHKACKALEQHKSRLIDQRGLHVNVMFGTIIVDTDTLTTRSDISWGLMDVAAEFSTIQSAVETWCSKHRRPQKMTRAAGGALKIA